METLANGLPVESTEYLLAGHPDKWPGVRPAQSLSLDMPAHAAWLSLSPSPWTCAARSCFLALSQSLSLDMRGQIMLPGAGLDSLVKIASSVQAAWIASPDVRTVSLKSPPWA